jgi:hypothetical protein
VLGIWELFASFGEWLWSMLTSIAAAVASALAAVWAAILPILVDIWHVFRSIWTDVLVPFWRKFEGWLAAARSWFSGWIAPLKSFLDGVYRFERAIYMATLGPILDTISHIQRLLTVLHLSHTALGETINNTFQSIENNLQNVWNTVTYPINQIIQTLQGYILDIDNLLKVDLLVNSVAKSFTGIWRVWWNYSLPALTPAASKLIAPFRTQASVRDHRQAVTQYLATKGGPLADALDGADDIFAAVLDGQDPRIPTDRA